MCMYVYVCIYIYIYCITETHKGTQFIAALTSEGRPPELSSLKPWLQCLGTGAGGWAAVGVLLIMGLYKGYTRILIKRLPGCI